MNGVKHNGIPLWNLLGGNTRYTGLVARGIMPTVWLVDLDSENNKENL